MENCVDLFIIGGGINGTAIAADAALSGLSVTLCDKGDLGSATSSASSKLIHGGLRYLELYEFNLVRKALREREILMRRAPNLIHPLEFVLPHEAHLRPAWMIRLGLFLYDHLAKRRYLSSSKQIKLKNDPRGIGLLPHLTTGFSYFDCFADDSRLVIANALLARENQATILTYTEFLAAEKSRGVWKIKLKNSLTQEIFYAFATVLVNVAGPWINEVNQRIDDTQTKLNIELVKGSHFIVPKIYAGDFAYILQNKDNRIIFTIPYLNDFTLIGTTDVLYNNDLNNIAISTAEIEYLCDIVNAYFKKSISKSDIRWSYAGVRCLQHTSDNPSEATRNYQFIIDKDHKAPLMTVVGGKLTTHRLLAEDAMRELRLFFPLLKPSQTANQMLPGSDFEQHDFNRFLQEFKKQYHWLPERIATHYATSYGTYAYRLLENAASIDDLGQHIGYDLFQLEVDYLIENECAKTGDDILWRRTKFGIYFTTEETKRLQQRLSCFN